MAEAVSIDIAKYCNKHSRNSLLKDSVVLSKPREIGSFSLDGNRKFANNRSQLAYLEDVCNPQKMDLNDGYEERFIKRDDNVKERLDNLLRWIISNLHHFQTKDDEKSSDKSLGKFPDFVLWRGHMTKIMCTPYENRDGWIMAGQKLGSTIYISEVETADAEKRRLHQTKKEKIMTYWGVRFEKYMTRHDYVERSSPKIRKLTPIDQKSVVVNTNEAFCIVLRTRLGSNNVIHGAEVDCCKHPYSGLEPPDNYVELKTSREFSSRQQEDNFHRYKTKKWWAQSYLAGVPQITCGFRNDDGIIVRISDFKTSELPRMALSVPGGGWNANISLLFLNEFLNEAKKAFCNVSNETVILFSWNPGESKISIKTHDAESQHQFIPEWYTMSLKHMKFI